MFRKRGNGSLATEQTRKEYAMNLGQVAAVYGRTDKEYLPGFSDYEDQREGTTFFADFSVAEPFGLQSVKDTFNRCFKEWKTNYKYLTELTMVLNHKGWQWYEKDNDSELAKFYFNAYRQCEDYAGENLNGDEAKFFYGVLD